MEWWRGLFPCFGPRSSTRGERETLLSPASTTPDISTHFPPPNTRLTRPPALQNLPPPETSFSAPISPISGRPQFSRAYSSAEDEEEMERRQRREGIERSFSRKMKGPTRASQPPSPISALQRQLHDMPTSHSKHPSPSPSNTSPSNPSNPSYTYNSAPPTGIPPTGGSILGHQPVLILASLSSLFAAHQLGAEGQGQLQVQRGRPRPRSATGLDRTALQVEGGRGSERSVGMGRSVSAGRLEGMTRIRGEEVGQDGGVEFGDRDGGEGGGGRDSGKGEGGGDEGAEVMRVDMGLRGLEFGGGRGGRRGRPARSRGRRVTS